MLHTEAAVKPVISYKGRVGAADVAKFRACKESHLLEKPESVCILTLSS